MFGLRFDSPVETISKTADIAEVAGIGGIGFELPAEIKNVIVYDPFSDVGTATPSSFEQLLPREDPSSSTHEEGKQLELNCSHLHCRAASTRGSLCWIA